MSLEVTNENDKQEDSSAQSEPKVTPWFSIVLIVLYSIVFVSQMVVGLVPSIELAGDDKIAVIKQHEIWRMLTGSALHGSIIHFAMNSYAFYSFGRLFEMLTNRYHLPIVFLFSAIAGSILSLIFNPQGNSVGASGGIVGVVGYLAVYSFKRLQFITPEFRRSLLINIGIILFYGVILSVRVDNAAHIGGLLCGATYALVQVSSDGYTDPRQTSSATETVGMLCIGIYAATCLFASLVIFRIF